MSEPWWIWNVVCGLNPEKVCAGYDSGCKSFIGVRPERRHKDGTIN